MSGRQFNAVKWGLLLAEVAMPTDNLQKYEEVRDGIVTALNPGNKLEELISSAWRRKRSYNIESEIFLE